MELFGEEHEQQERAIQQEQTKRHAWGLYLKDLETVKTKRVEYPDFTPNIYLTIRALRVEIEIETQLNNKIP